MVVDARLGRIARGVADGKTDTGQQCEGKQGNTQAKSPSRGVLCAAPLTLGHALLKKAYG